MEWIQNHTPAEWLTRINAETCPTTKKKLTREATSKLLIDKFRNDENLLGIWLEYIALERKTGQEYSVLVDLYKFLKSARVGHLNPTFFLHWATFEYESDHQNKAKSILAQAIQSGIEPRQDMDELLNSWNQEMKPETPIIDKENVYPGKFNSKESISKRTALQPKTLPVETSPPSNELPTSRKKHAARVNRFQLRANLGPPSRQSKKDSTIVLQDTYKDLHLHSKDSIEPTVTLLSQEMMKQSLEDKSFPCQELTPIKDSIDTQCLADMELTLAHPSPPLIESQPKVSHVEYQIPLKPEHNSPSKKKCIRVNQSEYQRMEIIGRGGSSKVYKIMNSKNGQIFALKKVKTVGEDQSITEGYLNEIDLLKKLRGNQHIIQLIDAQVNSDSILMVLEYGEIDLASILKKKNQKLSINSIKMYWEQMLNAVHTIHEQNIIHSDLKPANFLLVEGSLRLIDFGIAKTIPNDTTNIRRDHQTGTINFMSPESIMFVDNMDSKTLKIGRASDVWSLGCILYQMIYGSPPFAHISQVVYKLQCIVDPQYEIPYESLPNVPLTAIECIKGCLLRDPKQRKTIPQLLKMSFLSLQNDLLLTLDDIQGILERSIQSYVGKDKVDKEKIRSLAKQEYEFILFRK